MLSKDEGPCNKCNCTEGHDTPPLRASQGSDEKRFALELWRPTNDFFSNSPAKYGNTRSTRVD